MPASIKSLTKTVTFISNGSDKSASCSIPGDGTTAGDSGEVTVFEQAVEFQGDSQKLEFSGSYKVYVSTSGSPGTSDYVEGWVRVYVGGTKVFEEYTKRVGADITNTATISFSESYNGGFTGLQNVKVTLQVKGLTSTGQSDTGYVVLVAGSLLKVTHGSENIQW